MDRRQFLALPVAAAVASPIPRGEGRELPFRQVHLDFHTSELIPDVAADFDAHTFAGALKSARVNSVNVFAKDHHGYAYYTTGIGTPHPSLKTDLLGPMINACHSSGIAVNYYYSLVWDVLQSRKHPEWRAIDNQGNTIGGPPSDAWPWLCMNTPYLDHVVAENKGILGTYQTEGAWFDILKTPEFGCFCRWCRLDRERLRLHDTGPDIVRHNKLVAQRVERRLFELVRGSNPDALVFFNSRLVIGVRDELPYYSHIEIESLPTGGWGYSHFQQRVRYLRTLGKEMVGMTGRFHKSWGDFGGLKNQAALDFECLNFIANGAKACIGDQLHPRGRLDPATYQRVGRTYQKIEALEPWSRQSRAVAEIGVISTAAVNADLTASRIPPVDQGFTNMLIELHHQFDVLDLDSDLTHYKVLILPDEIPSSPKLLANVEQFLAAGGALLVTGESFQEPKILGVTRDGDAKFKQEYMLLRREIFPALEDTPYFLYQPGSSVTALSGTEVLATYGHPYFDRSPEHFSSHKQTPLGRRTQEPLITRRGKVVYIANPFFRSYALDGYGIQKLVVGALLKILLPQPAVVTNLPSTAQVTLLRQDARTVVHLLYYPLTRRAPNIDIIEEPGTLDQVVVRLRGTASRATLVPQNRPLPLRRDGNYSSVTVPRVEGHQAICFS